MQKAVKKVRVECADIAIGMYVCELDRPWLDSPFLLQGFYIKDRQDIDTVREVCEYVFVDKLFERDQITNNMPTAIFTMNIFEGSAPPRSTVNNFPPNKKSALNVCSISASVRNKFPLWQSAPSRKLMISTRLVFPALFLVCFSVAPGWLSDNKTFSPS